MRALLPLAIGLLLAARADAGCCTVVKIDAELPTVTVRVCEEGPPALAGPSSSRATCRWVKVMPPS